MEELRDLKKIYDDTNKRFNQYEGRDFILPEIFKERVKEINSNTSFEHLSSKPMVLYSILLHRLI